jgi:hypothetical protein
MSVDYHIGRTPDFCYCFLNPQSRLRRQNELRVRYIEGLVNYNRSLSEIPVVRQCSIPSLPILLLRLDAVSSVTE